MRKNIEKQMPLMPPKIDHPQAEELNAISCILRRTSGSCRHHQANV